MSEREQLMQILRTRIKLGNGADPVESLTDFLLESGGAVVPGTKVYTKNGGTVCERTVMDVMLNCGDFSTNISEFGTSVFLSREAAEAATSAEENVASQASQEAPECASPKESSSEIQKELTDLDIGFRVFKEDDASEMSTTYDYLFFCAINLGITLDKKIEQTIVCGSEILAYGGNELIACFAPFVDWEVVEMIINYKPKKVVFESCSFASNEEEQKADDAIRAALPGCEVYIVDLRQIVRRSQSESFGEYRKGYFKALLDAAEWLENHSEELKFTTMNSTKGSVACLKAMTQQLPEMLKYGRAAKIKVKLLNPKKVKEKSEKAKKTAQEAKKDWQKSAEEWAAFCDNGVGGNENE